MVYAQWDLEKRLVSLSKYTEQDFKASQAHMAASICMKDFVFRHALEELGPEFLHQHSFKKSVTEILRQAVVMVKEGTMRTQPDSHRDWDMFFVAFSGKYW